MKLVERYAKQTGLWADDLDSAQYERVLEFDLSKVERNLAGQLVRSTRLPTSELANQSISQASWKEQHAERYSDDQMQMVP